MPCRVAGCPLFTNCDDVATIRKPCAGVCASQELTGASLRATTVACSLTLVFPSLLMIATSQSFLSLHRICALICLGAQEKTDSTTGIQLQASRTYPEVSVEEYPAEGGMLVICHGGISQSKPRPAPARLQPFCEAWNSYVASRGEHCS